MKEKIIEDEINLSTNDALKAIMRAFLALENEFGHKNTLGQLMQFAIIKYFTDANEDDKEMQAAIQSAFSSATIMAALENAGLQPTLTDFAALCRGTMSYVDIAQAVADTIKEEP